MFGVNIRKLKEKGDVDGLARALLTEKSWETRRLAASALGDLKAPAALEPLGKAIRDENEEVRISAVLSLDTIGGDRAFELLCPALRDSSKYVRCALTSALASYGPREPLLALLKDEEKEVRDRAESALKRFEKDKQLFETLEFLEREFGVVNVGLPAHGEVKWGFFGNGSDRMADKLNQPEICFQTLQEFRDGKEVTFDKICIASGGRPYIVINSKPPFAIVISMDFDGILNLMKLIVNEQMKHTGKKPPIIDFEGVYVLDMP